MSKLAHSNDTTMLEIDFWHAYRDFALESMIDAPRDGRLIVAALQDDQSPNQEKVRMVIIAAVPLGCWKIVSGPLGGGIYRSEMFDGWLATADADVDRDAGISEPRAIL